MFKYFFSLILLSTNIATAQHQSNSLNGLVIYRQNINMVSAAINSDTLMFNRTKSIFEWNLYPTSNDGLRKAKEKYPMARVVKQPNTISFDGQKTLFDTSKDSLFSRMSMKFIDKVLYLSEKAPEINWTFPDSTKKVGNYMVQKATTHFRGHDYTAWFAPEIPVPYGPWKLHGLPGLILQAYNQTGDIYFSATDITLTEVGSIGAIPLNGDEQKVTFLEYKEISKNYKKYHRSATLKKVRPHVSKEDLANMTFDLQEIKQMEIFE